MDPETNRLIHLLYADPRDPAALQAVRQHLLRHHQYAALAKVLEWWAGKIPNRKQAAEGLFDAAELLEISGTEQSTVVGLLERALDRDSSLDLASIKLEKLYRIRGEKAKAAKLLARRNKRISLIEALEGVYRRDEGSGVSRGNRPSPSHDRDERLIRADEKTGVEKIAASGAMTDKAAIERAKGHHRAAEPARSPSPVRSVPRRPAEEFVDRSANHAFRDELAAVVRFNARSGDNGHGSNGGNGSFQHGPRSSVDSYEYELRSELPPPPKVPEFAVRFIEQQRKINGPSYRSPSGNSGFEEQPTSHRVLSPRGGLFAEAAASGSVGLEGTSTSSRSARPIPNIMPQPSTEEIDSDRLLPDDEDSEQSNPSDQIGSERTAHSAGVGYEPPTAETNLHAVVLDESGAPVACATEIAENQNQEQLARIWDDGPEEGYRKPGNGLDREGQTGEYRIVATTAASEARAWDLQQPAIEIDIIWGTTQVLHVDHLFPPRVYSVGDVTDGRGNVTTDFLIARETLGTDRLPIMVQTPEGWAVVVPHGASGYVLVGEREVGFEALLASGDLTPCGELSGARQLLLPGNASVYISYRGFTFAVKAGIGTKRVGVPAHLDFGLIGHTWNGVVAGMIALMLICFALLPPKSELISLDALHTDARLAKYLIEPPVIDDEKMPEWLEENQKDKKDTKSKKDQEAKKKPEPSRNNFRHPSYAAERPGERASRLLSVLASPSSNDGQTLQKVVANLGTARGGGVANPFSLSGALASLNGLGGVSLGGGSSALALGNAGGEAAAGGVRKLEGRGGGRGGVRGKVRALSLGSRVSGSLTQGQVLEVINRHMAKIQQCYERGLTRNPTLGGQVKFDWTVTPAGAVSGLRQASSTLGDVTVTGCMSTCIQRMQFPKPKGGAVTISFPFIFRRAQ
jgi:hypothetical protein